MKLLSVLLLGIFCFAQNFTQRDTLMGSLRHERTCFNVLHYHLNIEVDVEQKHLKGYNAIQFEVVEPTQKIQIDLFENMAIDSIVWMSKRLNYKRLHDAVFIDFPQTLEKNSTQKINFYYQGHPVVAKNAPWDGGFVWSKDKNNQPFIGVAVQGTGASLWMPVKDHQTDEPDHGAQISVTIPNELVCVSNGNLISKEILNAENKTTWHWAVVNPINSYNITINIGNYVLIEDSFGDLNIQYWVLEYHKQKAIQHFGEVHDMFECFEGKFGSYPFRDDGYKMVETPYLGMEHQSAVAYGNKFTKGYLGNDISGTGVGLAFDYIIIHETAHEWFGNSITSKDIADMWIHESFTTYAETVYVECTQGYDNAMKYINGQKKLIANKKPMIGYFGVNYKMKSSDHYFKGALLLNTLRHTFDDDEWWKVLKLYTETFKLQIIESKDVVDFFQEHTSWNSTPFFEHYLHQTNLPKLKIKKVKNGYQLYFEQVSDDFEMLVEVNVDDKNSKYLLSTQPKFIKSQSLTIDKNKYYINVNF